MAIRYAMAYCLKLPINASLGGWAGGLGGLGASRFPHPSGVAAQPLPSAFLGYPWGGGGAPVLALEASVIVASLRHGTGRPMSPCAVVPSPSCLSAKGAKATLPYPLRPRWSTPVGEVVDPIHIVPGCLSPSLPAGVPSGHTFSSWRALAKAHSNGRTMVRNERRKDHRWLLCPSKPLVHMRSNHRHER